MKRILSLTMAALLICATLPAGVLASGPDDGEADTREEIVDVGEVTVPSDDASSPADLPEEPAVPEPAESAPVESEPVESEPVESEPVDSEPVVPMPVAPRPVMPVPTVSEPEESDPEESEPAELDPEEIDPEGVAPMETPEPMVIAMSVGGASVQGNIVVDGNLSDWANVSGYPGGPSTDSLIYDGWKVCMDGDGNLYIAAWGTANTEWASPEWGNFTITQSGRWDGGLQFGNLRYSGGKCVIINEANQNTPGPFYLEAMVPASFFSDPNFVFTFNNLDLRASDIEVVDGTDVIPEPDEDPVYTGIVIDGQYNDWDAVAKYPAPDPDGWLDSAAMVFDGDMVYIYIKEAPGGDATNVGTHHNGQYAITTDLGKTLLVQLTKDNTVAGIDGATAAHVGTQWEIAIPASALPEYLESISFGLYQYEPFFVEGVVNLDGSTGNGDTNFDGIVYDGNYRDWDYYPHTLIQYATAGTQEHVADAEGAIYADGSILYGHFYSTMPEHVQAGTYDLAYDISIRFNGDTYFFPSMFTRNSDGSINWYPNLSITEPGTYEFNLSYTADYHNAPSMSDPNYTGRIDAGPYSNDWSYGRIFITVSEDRIECEFFLDLEVIAERLGMDASDFKLIEAQFGRLGQEWVTTAGSSSGAWLGVGLSVAVVCGVLIWRKKRSGVAVAVAE